MRVLIFGTGYVDTEEKRRLAQYWADVNRTLNPGVDLMLVDSQSPLAMPRTDNLLILDTGPNIGHLARGGQDGWGRAFTSGLSHALALDYDYVVHIEGDSLFRWPVTPIVEHMRRRNISCISTAVQGTRHVEQGWTETGLMFFDVCHVADVIRRYDWRNGRDKRYPHCPEWHMNNIARPHMMPWRAERGDRGQVRAEDAHLYDWVTHVPLPVAEAFVRSL